MLDVEITGDSHPKNVTLLLSDQGTETTADIIDQLREAALDEYAEKAEKAPLGDDGIVRVEVDTPDIGEMIEFVELAYFDCPAHGKLEEMRADAYRQAEEALANDDD